MLHTNLIPFTAPNKTGLPADQPPMISLADRAHASSACAAQELALTPAQAVCLIASLCGLHGVPMDAALLTQRLVSPISLDQVVALLPTLGIEAQVLQPKHLLDALQPGRLLQVGLHSAFGNSTTLATHEGASAPLLLSCESPAVPQDDSHRLAYAWVSIAETSDRGRQRRVSAAAR